MNCPAFEERIARYAGGDLTAAACLPVEQHLRVCAGCAELARGLEEDREWLSRRPIEAAQVDFVAMRREIRRRVASPRTSRPWLPALAAAAAILLAILPVTRWKTPAAPPAEARHVAAAPLPYGHGSDSSVPSDARVPQRRVAAAAQLAHFVPPVRHVEPPAATAETGLTLEAAMRMFQELEPEPPEPPAVSDAPVEMRIATHDPQVTIILVQETNGDSK